MKITQAMKAAQSHVYTIRFVNQWVVTMPCKDIGGPTTHSSPRSYREALLRSAIARAELALELLGYDFETQCRAYGDVYAGMDWKSVVRKYHKNK